MLVDKVIKYYDKEYDLNCAECMLVAANEEYNLEVSKESLKPLKAEYFHEEDRCLKMMITAAKSLEDVINKYKERYI